MKKMNHVLLYGNYEAILQLMPPADVGRLTLAMLHYLNTGEEIPPVGKGFMIWAVVKDQIDRNMKKYEEVCKRNRKNAKKFWDAQKGLQPDATGTASE